MRGSAALLIPKGEKAFDLAPRVFFFSAAQRLQHVRQRPRCRRACADDEGALAGPEHDRAAVIPAVDRVAPVAHVAGVLALEWAEVVGWAGIAKLLLADEQRECGWFPGAGRASQLDLAVDQIRRLEFVVGTVVFAVELLVVIVPFGVFRMAFAFPRLVHVGLREQDLTVEPLRRRAQRRRARRVGALEQVPAKPARGVLVIEQIDEAVGLSGGAAEARRDRRPEVTLQCAGENIERLRLDPRRHGPGDALGHEVVGQHDAGAAGHAANLVAAVGVEGDQLQCAAAAPEGHRLAVLLDDHRSSAELRRKSDHQRSDHRIGFLRVLVRPEELPLLVQQHVVQIGPQFHALGQAERGADFVEQRDQGLVPAALIDADAPPGDFPTVADAAVEDGLVPQSVEGWLRHVEKSRDRLRREGKSERTDARDFDAQGLRRRGTLHGERAGRSDVSEELGNLALHGLRGVVYGDFDSWPPPSFSPFSSSARRVSSTAAGTCSAMRRWSSTEARSSASTSIRRMSTSSSVTLR
jgi:hypothetical protein